LFHHEPNRSSLTVEFWFILPPTPRSGSNEGAGNGIDDDDDDDTSKGPLPLQVPQVLACRTLAVPSSNNSEGSSSSLMSLWSLYLLPSGALRVSLAGESEVNSLHTENEQSPFCATTSTSTGSSNNNGSVSSSEGVVSAGKWHHVALVISSRFSQLATPTNKSVGKVVKQTCEVSLFVDGEVALVSE